MRPCCRSQRRRSLTRRFAAARLLGLRVRIPPDARVSSVVVVVVVVVYVLSGICLCVRLNTRPEDSYRV